MARAKLTIDLGAIADNWRRLNRLASPGSAAAAVVKADAYGLGADRVVEALHRIGVRTFFVALAEEGASIRGVLGGDAEIFVLSGIQSGDEAIVSEQNLIPVLNSAEQFQRFLRDSPGRPHAVQVDTGMNRLGMEASEFGSIRDRLLESGPTLVMSHLACADEPSSPLNKAQLAEFKRMTRGLDARLSLAATGGMLLGSEYHFDLCRPGVGLFGGLPFADAVPVVRLELPVIQVRNGRARRNRRVRRRLAGRRNHAGCNRFGRLRRRDLQGGRPGSDAACGRGAVPVGRQDFDGSDNGRCQPPRSCAGDYGAAGRAPVD